MSLLSGSLSVLLCVLVEHDLVVLTQAFALGARKWAPYHEPQIQ